MNEKTLAETLPTIEEVEIGELCNCSGIVCARTDDTWDGQRTSAAVLWDDGTIANAHTLSRVAYEKLVNLL